MKILMFSLFFISGIIGAQSNRFVYEYQYIPNKNQKEDVKKEMMALDIDSKGSAYESLEQIAQDSIMKAEIDKAMAGGGNNFNIKSSRRSGDGIGYKVTKNYPDYEVYLHQGISMDRYKIKEEEKISWKILQETQQIGVYKAQKAVTDFGGRSWIAWFSTELPFQDGPYKFYGLPGLIVKIEDSTGSHIMTLVANKNIIKNDEEKKASIPGVSIMGLGGNEIAVTEKQFKKVYQDYLSDPAKSMKQLMGGIDPNQKVVFKMKTQDGREISDMNEMAKMMEKRVKESHEKNNNRIEPSLYE